MRLRQLARAYRRTTTASNSARDALVAEVVAALNAGETQATIVKEIGFTREWVRRALNVRNIVIDRKA